MACNITEESVLYNRKDLYVCGYANIILCAIGTFFNFFIYMVYSQKYMISPMHTIISNLAVVDIICMIVYIPHSWQELIRVTWTRIEEHRTETWEWCSFYSWHLTAMFTHVSIWLTVILGVWRYIGIIHPLKERSWCNTRTTRFAIAACYILGAIVSIPAFLISDVRRTEIPLTNNNTNNCITIYDIEITLDSYDFIFTVTAIFYGVILKILPLAVLAMISYRLIKALRTAEYHHEQLTRNTSTLSTLSNGVSPRNSLRNRQTAKITKMLLIVLVIFVIKELPHGICSSLTAIFGTKFYDNYYYYLSEIFNTMNYFCTCSYFVVYYIMSYKFRNTFKVLVKCKAPSSNLYQNTYASCVYNMSYHCNSPIVNTFPQNFSSTSIRS